MQFLFILFLLLTPTKLFGYSAKTLKMKDYTEMKDLVDSRIKKSKDMLKEFGEGSALEELETALRILLTRPDTDGTQSSLLLNLQTEITRYNPFMTVLQEVVDQAISLWKSRRTSPAVKVSQLYLLENALAYLQSIEDQQSSVIIKQIKDAKLRISKKMSSYLLLTMDRGKAQSPSRMAGRILKERKDAEKKEAATTRKATKRKKGAKTK